MPATSPISAPLVSVVIPCLNEEESIAECVRGAFEALAENSIAGEVIVVDNASEDASAERAREAGAKVVYEPRRGYGSAYLAGFAAAAGDYIVMVDADLTYDFAEIPRFVKELDDGAQMVLGNRMQGIEPGAMPVLNRYIGNPLLSGLYNLFFRTKIGDVHCGMRAVRRDVLPQLDLRTTGMEFASEMVIRASKQDLDMREFPIKLHPRTGESKLSPFRDGWRHLRLLLVYSPDYVFVVPGVLMVLAGTFLTCIVLGEVKLFGHGFFIHTLIVGSMLLILGVQAIGLGICARAFGVYVIGDRDPWLQRMQSRFRLEHGLLLGAVLGVSGLALGGVVLAKWVSRDLGALSEQRLAVVAATLVILGAQVCFTSLLLSILGLRADHRRQ